MPYKNNDKNKKYTLSDTIFNAERSFYLSYLNWLYKQNPYFAERFSTEDIVNYLNNIKIPWALQKIRKDNPLKFYQEIYTIIEDNKDKADVFKCTTSIVPLQNEVDFSFCDEKIRYISLKQKNELKRLNEQSHILSSEDIDNMEFLIGSLSISLMKKI